MDEGPITGTSVAAPIYLENANDEVPTTEEEIFTIVLGPTTNDSPANP